MEHHPVRHTDDAILGLIQGRKLRLEGIVGHRHVDDWLSLGRMICRCSIQQADYRCTTSCLVLPPQ